jgi:hypothetical protein
MSLNFVFLQGVWPTVIYLYIDPTAGGMIIQFMLGGLVSFIVIFKLMWGRIKHLTLSGLRSIKSLHMKKPVS